MKETSTESLPQEDIVKSFKPSRVILPLLLGIGVVAYLIWNQFDINEYKTIKWDNHALLWVSIAILAYVIRHLLYAWRLSTLTDWQFSFRKSIQLIFIWEFASSVSPTSIGGSAVALFLLAQEKIKGAMAITAVMYSVIIDTLFFIISMPLLYFILGPIIIRPGMETLDYTNGYGLTFVLVWLFMLVYGSLMTYGLIKPRIIRRMLMLISRIFFLKRYRKALYQVGQDLQSTAKEIRTKKLGFHVTIVVTTFGAWFFRFLTVNFIIIAFVKAVPTDFVNQMIMYARSETMYAITQFSPTPGAAGVSELLFGGFFSDYISKGIASIIALIWRLITYYPYLIAGMIIVPVWLRSIITRR